MAYAGDDGPVEEKKAEVDHGTPKHLQLQFYNVPVESFEMSLSLDHCHTKLSVEILEMFPHTIKLR